MRLRVCVSLVWFGQMRFFGIIFTGIIPLLPKVGNRIWSILLLDSHTVSFLGRHRTIVHDPLTFLCVVTQMPWREGRRGGATSRWAHIAGRSDGGGRGQLFSMSSTLLSFSLPTHNAWPNTQAHQIFRRWIDLCPEALALFFFFFWEGETFLLSWS
jgi:hypothetical protein